MAEPFDPFSVELDSSSGLIGALRSIHEGIWEQANKSRYARSDYATYVLQTIKPMRAEAKKLIASSAGDFYYEQFARVWDDVFTVLLNQAPADLSVWFNK